MKRKIDRCLLSLAAAATFITILGLDTYAQEPKKDVAHYLQQAAKAYKEKQYAAYLENARAVVEMRPNQPRYLYNLACAYALTGDSAAALLMLNRVAAMGLVYPADTDEDLLSLKDTGEFKAIVNKFAANKKPVSHSSTAFSIPQKGLVTEGIAYDPKTKTYYLSSIHKRKVISVDSRGHVRDFSSVADGLWSATGIKIDLRRRKLWVASAGHRQMTDFDEADDGASGIFKFNLDTGRLLRKYLLPAAPQKHWLGDLVITRTGDVYATDSINPQIYRISAKTDVLELFAEIPQMVSPQGLALAPNEGSLFVADYSTGLFKLDLKTKKIADLSAPGIATVGIDGLYFYRDSLVAIQNGTRPNRIVRLRLNRTLDSIKAFDVLEAHNPLFDEPTQGVIVDKTLFYIANSQWGSIDKDGTLTDLDTLVDPLILKLRLDQ